MKGGIEWARRTSHSALRKSHPDSCAGITTNLLTCTNCRPSLMGTHTGAQIADASLQARVLDTILNNATAIFDED